MRLDKYLADTTGLSRSDLKKLIKKGKAEVEGSVIRDPGFGVGEDSHVTLEGKEQSYRRYVWYMLNKPAGLVSATEDRREKCVLDLFEKEAAKGLFPVGRLDKDTEGLLLITNDGRTAHRLLSPRFHVDKVYFARLDKEASEADCEAFAAGLQVDDDFRAMPAKLELPDGKESREVRITIHEGKFHQIKRMFEAVGKEVLYLKRLSMGPVCLDDSLSPGAYRELTAEELTGLQKAAGLSE